MTTKLKYEWTEADQAAAMTDGWFLAVLEDGKYEIQRRDDLPRFDGDAGARAQVEEQATAGDPLCTKALHFLGKEAPQYIWGDESFKDRKGPDGVERAIAESLAEQLCNADMGIVSLGERSFNIEITARLLAIDYSGNLVGPKTGMLACDPSEEDFADLLDAVRGLKQFGGDGGTEAEARVQAILDREDKS